MSAYDRERSIVAYRGPSVLDGAPIVATVVPGTSNRTTGPTMLQVYVMRADVRPVEAVRCGADSSVCGDCPLRGGVCYVNVARPVTGTWMGAAGLEPVPLDQLPAWIDWRPVRLTAYGDPAALPREVVEALTSNASGWSGYTHQWRRRDARYLQAYCMASVETATQRRQAYRAGWRTFRIMLPRERLLAGERACPAKTSSTRRRRFAPAPTTCDRCYACSGLAKDQAPDVAVYVHGQHAPAAYASLREGMRG